MRRFVLASLIALAGCTRPVRPDDLSAAEHRQAAERERQATIKELDRYDPNAEVKTLRRVEAPDSDDAYDDLPGYNPTRWHLEAAERHHDHALEHERAATELEVFEDVSCAFVPPRTRVSCPLLTGVRTVRAVPNGVRITFDSGADIAKIAERIRCHVAFARTRGFEIPSCPLTVRGLEVSESPEQLAITLTTRGHKEVNALRRGAYDLAPAPAPAAHR